MQHEVPWGVPQGPAWWPLPPAPPAQHGPLHPSASAVGQMIMAMNLEAKQSGFESL